MKKVFLILILSFLSVTIFAGGVVDTAKKVGGAAKDIAVDVADFTVDKFYQVVDNMYEADTKILAGSETNLSSNNLTFPVGEDFYLRIDAYVRKAYKFSIGQEVTFQVIFPATDATIVELVGIDGDQNYSSVIDPITRNQTFTFKMETMPAEAIGQPMSLTYRCKPLVEGEYDIQIVYDRTIAPKFDRYKKFTYVIK